MINELEYVLGSIMTQIDLETLNLLISNLNALAKHNLSYVKISQITNYIFIIGTLLILVSKFFFRKTYPLRKRKINLKLIDFFKYRYPYTQDDDSTQYNAPAIMMCLQLSTFDKELMIQDMSVNLLVKNIKKPLVVSFIPSTSPTVVTSPLEPYSNQIKIPCNLDLTMIKCLEPGRDNFYYLSFIVDSQITKLEDINELQIKLKISNDSIRESNCLLCIPFKKYDNYYFINLKT